MLTLFLLATLYLPYAIYTLLAHLLRWRDCRRKNAVQHANELVSSSLLVTSLYYLGGYQESFCSFVIPLVTVVVVIGFGGLSEWGAVQTSLDRFRHWNWKMWMVVTLALLVGLGFAYLHVDYAIGRWGPKVAVAGYCGTFLLVPLFGAMLVLSLAALERQRGSADPDDFEMEGQADDERGAILHDIGDDDHEAEDQEEEEDDDDDEQGRSNRAGARVATQPEAGVGRGMHDEDELDRLHDIPPVPLRRAGPVKIRKKLILHLHHYQIFAHLALFTRFPTIWSQVAAGLVLGSMVHGVAAYGVDSIFEYEEDLG